MTNINTSCISSSYFIIAGPALWYSSCKLQKWLQVYPFDMLTIQIQHIYCFNWQCYSVHWRWDSVDFGGKHLIHWDCVSLNCSLRVKLDVCKLKSLHIWHTASIDKCPDYHNSILHISIDYYSNLYRNNLTLLRTTPAHFLTKLEKKMDNSQIVLEKNPLAWHGVQPRGNIRVNWKWQWGDEIG